MTFTSTGRPRAGSASRSSPRSRSDEPAVTGAGTATSSRSASITPTSSSIPASLPRRLAGGAERIEVRCISPTQYLGMAESDLYILTQPGNFGLNFMMGLFGIWLQAMVLTAIGVFAGTFLSWPMALLTTIAFFVAGQVAFSFLLDFTRQSLLGGGPFESLIRLLTHDNQMTRADADARGGRRQDVRRPDHAGHVAAGLRRPQLRGARRHQHGGRGVRRRRWPRCSATPCWPSATPCRSPSPAISS